MCMGDEIYERTVEQISKLDSYVVSCSKHEYSIALNVFKVAIVFCARVYDTLSQC